MSRRAAIKLLTPAQLVALPPKATAILDASWHSQSSISVPALRETADWTLFLSSALES